jgi:hypothetical protein
MWQIERPKGRGTAGYLSSAEKNPPLWASAVGTVGIPKLVHQLGEAVLAQMCNVYRIHHCDKVQDLKNENGMGRQGG